MGQPTDAPLTVNDRTPQPVQPTGLEWATIAAQLGLNPPPQTSLLPLKQVDKPVPANPEAAPKQEGAPTADEHEPEHKSDAFSMYNIGRHGALILAGAEAARRGHLTVGNFGQRPLGGMLVGAGVAIVDGALDDSVFRNVPRRAPSIVADVASTAILFTPQPPHFKAAEMIGLHVLGRFGDKWL